MTNACILWPKTNSKNEPYELQYAEKFCKIKAESIGIVVEYNPESPLVLYHKHIKDFSAVLIVTDPQVIVSSSGYNLLISHAINTKSIIGPVFTNSKEPCQIASIPYIYYDYYTFEEVAQIMTNHDRLIAVDRLDYTCFSCTLELILDKLDFSALDLVSSNATKFVSIGSLAHNFRYMFGYNREELIDLLPDNTYKVLDVGCAEGKFGQLLVSRKKAVMIDGVEVNSSLATAAKQIYRHVFVGRFEESNITERYDAIILGDVLEHMYDPWEALGKVYHLLNPGGVLIGSVPNVAHWSIVRQILKGEFEYVPAGLLCVSHIRFFTPSSLRTLLEETGFYVDIFQLIRQKPTPEGGKFINALLSEGIADASLLETEKIIFRAVK